MKKYRYLCLPRYLISLVIAAGTSILLPMAIAAEAMAPEAAPASEDSRPGPVGLGVSGTSAGITPDYFEQAISDALVASEIFSGIDNSKTVEFVMPMIRAQGVFPGTSDSKDTPYFLNIRIIKVDAPSFSTKMTVSMNAVWELYDTAEKAQLFHENILSTYTGGFFEGGLIGANRVRAATEGAARENVRIGMEILKALDFERD